MPSGHRGRGACRGAGRTATAPKHQPPSSRSVALHGGRCRACWAPRDPATNNAAAPSTRPADRIARPYRNSTPALNRVEGFGINANPAAAEVTPWAERGTLARMSTSRSSSPMLFAPGAASSKVSAYAPGRNDPLPPVDARLVEPETHAEVVRGVRVETMGSNEPHATQHIEVSMVFRGCLAPGYAAANDMLTRLDDDSDRAPDVSVFPKGRDPRTGGRRLEEIAFEVCASESEAHVTEKALAFAERGVRRVFYVDVADRTVHEWQHAQRAWKTLDPQSAIVDRCFAVPIPAAALVDEVLADDTVARALITRKNRVIQEALGLRWQEGRREGLRDGMQEGALAASRQALRALMDALGLACTPEDDDRIETCTDLARLQAWIVATPRASSARAVLDAATTASPDATDQGD